MTRYFTIAAAVCLLLAGSADAHRTSLRPGDRISVGGRSFVVGSPGDNHPTLDSSVGRRRVVGPDIIDIPNGTPQEYSKLSGGYYFYGGYNAYQDADQAATVYWDGDDAYIYNILSYKETDSYVLGKREGDVLRVELNQMVDRGEDFAIRLGLLKTDLAVGENPDWRPGSDEEDRYITYIFFNYNTDYSTVDYAIGDDGSLTLVIPEAPDDSNVPDDGYEHLDPAEFGFPDYCLGFYYTDDLTWTGDGDIFQEYTEFNYELVSAPEILDYDYFSYVNSYDMGVLVYIGRIDDTLYVKSLSPYASDAVFKANLVETETGLKAYVPQNQFIGRSEDGYYNLLTKAAKYDRGKYVLLPADSDAVFNVTVDEATGKIVSLESLSTAFLVFNYAGDTYDPYDEFPGVTLTYQETLFGTPQNPAGAYFEDHSKWLGANYLFFYLDQFSTEGYILDVDELYFRVFINGSTEPYVFEQKAGENLAGNFVTMYQGITEPTTLIPYTVYNGMDLFSDEYHLFYVGFYTFDIDSIAVQAVYTYGGQTVYSDITEADMTGVETLYDDAQAVAVDFYSLDGRRVADPERGIFIKMTRYSDGKTRVEKVAF